MPIWDVLPIWLEAANLSNAKYVGCNPRSGKNRPSPRACHRVCRLWSQGCHTGRGLATSLRRPASRHGPGAATPCPSLLPITLGSSVLNKQVAEGMAGLVPGPASSAFLLYQWNLVYAILSSPIRTGQASRYSFLFLPLFCHFLFSTYSSNLVECKDHRIWDQTKSVLHLALLLALCLWR